jgi:hypothetical protein
VYVGADAVIVALPGASPVTCGAVAGCVAPAAMVTEVGAIETVAGLLLDSVTVTPPAGAGVDNVTGKAADWPSPTLTPEGKLMLPPL